MPKPKGQPRQGTALRVLSWFSSISPRGATANECSVGCGVIHHTVTTRISELVRAGCLEDTGERRATQSGSSTAAVHRYKPGSSFKAYLGLVSRKSTSRVKITSEDMLVLSVSKTYLRSIQRARSKGQVKKALLKLITDLNEIAKHPK